MVAGAVLVAFGFMGFVLAKTGTGRSMSEDSAIMSLVENCARRQHRAIDLLHDKRFMRSSRADSSLATVNIPGTYPNTHPRS